MDCLALRYVISSLFNTYRNLNDDESVYNLWYDGVQ